MQPEQLRIMVESGNYRPEPALVAQAMLRRRGLRELLAADRKVGTLGGRISRADRTPEAPAAHPQAA
jgi:hypothetical protein